MKIKLLLSILLLVAIVVAPAIAYAHCAGLYWSDTVISWFTAGASWGSSYVDTTSYQRWGAPYCWVRDGHLLYKRYNNTWNLVEYTYWYDYDSDTGFDHVWVPHDQRYWLSSGNYLAKMRGSRYANHASVVPHYQDVDTIDYTRY